MYRLMAVCITVVLSLLAGCGAPGPELADSAKDVVGTWQSINLPGPKQYVQFFENGTLHDAQHRELVEDRPITKAEFWFEGKQLFMEESLGVCHNENPTGIYEVHLLANGNLKFVKIEDECAYRVSSYQGPGGYEGLVEYEPAP